MSAPVIAVANVARYERARGLFDSAERLATQAATRGTTLTQLDLYRQSTYWALASLTPAQPNGWSPLLAGLPALGEREAQVLTASTAADDGLDDAQLGEALAQVKAAAARAFAVVEAPDRALREQRHRHVVRRATVFVLLLAIGPIAYAAVNRALAPVDLAKGKAWRASSKIYDCHPEMIECGGVRTPIFFHTVQENNPWLEIDLGAPTEFSSVAVYNRSDGWGDRAFPMALEVGDDQKEWRELARQDTEVKVWTPSFEKTTARYVRLRVLRNSLLHLDAVRVYR